MPIGRDRIRSTLMTNRVVSSLWGDVMQIRAPERVFYAAAVEIRDYDEETEPGQLNLMMEAGFEFVLTQSFSLIAKTKAQSALAKQQRLLINAEDASRSQVEGISAALDDLAANRVAFGEHHLSLAVRAANTRELNDRVAIARSSLAETGFVVVREDVCLEAAFLAQLPGNWKERPRPAPNR